MTLTSLPPRFTRDVHFRSKNIGAFVENAFHITEKWSISPGLRWESGTSKMTGNINYYPAGNLPTSIHHQFLLLGLSTQYKLDEDNQFYSGFSQSYRPVLFKDIIPASTFERIDKDLKDALGYNIDAGFRGKILKRIQYDLSFFSLLYKNRMGTMVLQDDNGNPYIYRTTVGNSRTNGIEGFLQYKFPLTNALYAGAFTSSSFMHARYISGQVSTGTANKSITGNKVESVPTWISRSGVDILYKGFSGTVLYSYTSSSYSDPVNTVTPPATGARGLVPSYALVDFNASLKTNSPLSVRAGINNIFNKQYFTKRPTMYPGAGIWPGDGRNYYVTVAVRL